ncbi:MBL fold metallo-hydrolase [Schumannella luteola]|uniref:L-ascorbate metabolism protein UlaG (Beta-lactamase superfamily) n=1 Tax=Schumannella luteola TaxID=472059 RepID=A0A852Y8L2_9MICO|nr:MBL fold metallo-hydrolase [Schumannella luteola]NYG97644.1 L-ascorbate metabolism protein UlaG (beta-lactamase superfamily) [Schumannella luteola]TPX04694.1 MBL fold metallo-hydrolase [Schumannella luteola]
MELTKHTHATIVLSDSDRSLVIDPGAYTPNSADLVAATTAVLITHDHPDHYDAGILTAALAAQPELRVWAPANVAAELTAAGADADRVTAVGAGDGFEAAGFPVEVVGGTHAVIHSDIPEMSNVGYLIAGDVYHPGDAYFVPEQKVTTLLVPTSGPWAKLGELVDFVRAVKPVRAIQIHDLMLSDAGKGSSAQFAQQLTGIELVTLADGQSITL